MAVTQDHLDAATPVGATLVADGATFRVWAPGAEHVYVVLGGTDPYTPDAADELEFDPATGDWTGFVPGVTDGERYRFFVVGPDGQGLKRDPWARELESGDYASRDGLVRPAAGYPWHDAGWRPPALRDLTVYQLHVGVFDPPVPGRGARLLDAAQRIPYLADLGVTAVQPLPFAEFQTPSSLGYNGTDLFSPETDYCVPPEELGPYVEAVNALLAAKGCAPVNAADLERHPDQLKAFVDLCHGYGLAVIADVVYNHAGGELDAGSLDHFDWRADRDLYFSGAGWAGGRVFDFAQAGVRRFLTGNALQLLEEFHVDGLRFDEVTVIANFGGWDFAQQLTGTVRAAHPDATLIAEYWGERRLAVLPPPTGMGFDAGYADGLRDSVRGLVGAATAGADAALDLGPLTAGLQRPWGVPRAWQAYNCLENQDLVLDADGDHRHPRIAALADATNARSWYARSRARVAMGLLLTAPGVPLLFMGQEFLEDKLWSDDPARTDRLIWWAGLEGQDPAMADFHRFTRDLLWLRRHQPALRDDPVTVYPPDDRNRVQAFQRWVPGAGHDVVVVATLSETTLFGYGLGLPAPGEWLEVFNSDVYDHWVNPWRQGNGGSVVADGPPLHGMAQSATLTIPANGLLVLARDAGDAA